jgi:hypothetical protein
MFNRVTILSTVALIIVSPMLYASHESRDSHHVRSASWAYPLQPLHHGHARKLSWHDKSYYESLPIDAGKLSTVIQKFLWGSSQKSFNSTFDLLKAFQKVQSQVHELEFIAGKLNVYGTQVQDNEMIAKSKTIAAECAGYQKQLKQFNEKYLLGVQPVELKRADDVIQPPTRPTSPELAVLVDDMKTGSIKMLQSQRHHHGHHSRSQSRSGALASIRAQHAAAIPELHDEHAPLDCYAKVGLGALATTLVAGMTLLILHCSGRL